MKTLQATHGGKGRNFLTRWKGEDLNYKYIQEKKYRKACGGTGETATVAIFWGMTYTNSSHNIPKSMQMKAKITTLNN